MLCAYWGELGILVHTGESEAWPLTQLIRANGHDAVVSSVNGGLDVVENPGIYMPHDEYDSCYAIPWVYWYADNSLGEEPPPQAREQMRLYEQIKGSTVKSRLRSSSSGCSRARPQFDCTDLSGS